MEQQGLTLYHAIPSRGFIVHWMLEELDVTYNTVILDIEAEEHKKTEYLAVNPMGKIPSLMHGDKLVTESAAIVMYLAESFPEAGLEVYASSPLRNEYLRWFFFAPGTMEPAIISKAMGFDSQEYKPFADIESVASTLVAALEGRAFIVGDTFTAADVVIGSAINWGLNLMPVLPKHPVLTDYWARLEKRPAWQKVAKTMGET